MNETDKDTLCRRIVETVGDAVLFADRDGIIRLWMQAAKGIFGVVASTPPFFRKKPSQTNGNTDNRYSDEQQCFRVGNGCSDGKNTHDHSYHRK